MHAAAKSIFIFGLYMIGEGLILLLAPNLLLSLVNLPTTQEVWIRIVGLSLVILGYYYVKAAKSELSEFFKWTVQVRIGQFFVFLTFVLLGFVPWVILIFAGIELFSGIWTWKTLQNTHNK